MQDSSFLSDDFSSSNKEANKEEKKELKDYQNELNIYLPFPFEEKEEE